MIRREINLSTELLVLFSIVFLNLMTIATSVAEPALNSDNRVGMAPHSAFAGLATLLPLTTVVPLGAYFGIAGSGSGPSGLYPGFDAQWDGFTRIMGRPPSINMVFMDQGYAPDSSRFGWPAQGVYSSSMMASDSRTLDAIPIVSVPFGYNPGTGSVNLFARLAAGGYDTEIYGMLGAWKAGGYSTLYLRPAWEFNLPNNYSVNSNNVTTFIAALQHFYTVAHAYAAANGMNVSVIWCPSVGRNQNDPTLTVARQYPGNPFVDIIAIDSYGAPLYPGNDATAQTTDPTQYLVTTMIAIGKASKKPIAGTEIGGADNTFAGGFVSTMAHAETPIAFIALWDVADSNYNLSWSNPVDNRTALAAIWAAALGADGTIRN